MDGILILDKPGGMTSHDVVVRLRRLLGTEKIGHSGTLDPNATGVLIGLIGKATKISRFLMSLGKEYIFTIQLGVETDTLDKWGKVVAVESCEGVGPTQILDAASRFRGRYQQIAPSLSAIKHRGTPLYKLARRGLATPLKTRVVQITDFQVLDISMPYVTIRVACSSGTYVRSLARDMGRHLGCGASVTSLRRITIGSFTIDTATPLNNLLEGRTSAGDVILSIEKALEHLPKIGLKAASVRSIRSGRQPCAADFDGAAMGTDGKYVALTDEAGTIIGIAVRGEHPDAELRTERIL